MGENQSVTWAPLLVICGYIVLISTLRISAERSVKDAEPLWRIRDESDPW